MGLDFEIGNRTED